jgi:hypothetical protein
MSSYGRLEMSTTPDHEEVPQACQAIPGVARRGWRADLLCASSASTDVPFSGRMMGVCRMHQATYVRWGAEAERKAAELWGWRAGPAAGG